MRRVVVTGLGVISPVGNDVDTFWANLQAGVNGIGVLDRFDASEFKVKLAAQVKDFDPLAYMDKAEVRKNDLFCQYAMAAASQAVARSRIEGNIDPERFGVYFGSGIGGIETFSLEAQKLIEKGPKRISPFFITMLIANMAGGMIAIRHGAKGPCLPVTTACATSTNAIGEAYRAIRFGFADAVIAGGAEAAITPISVAGFTSCMALSTAEDPAAASIPFDKRRNGFVMGEGAGALILEEYEHAKQRGAHILAEITGYGITCDAYHITAPDPEGTGAARAITQALDESGYQDGETVYLNAHGTSTPLNDKTETLAIKTAFLDKTENLFVSSTKSMTGHMLGAAGAVEAIAAVLTLRDGVAAPTIGYEVPDPDCDLNYLPNKKYNADYTLALSTSLGFGGHNACVAFRKGGETV